MGAKRITALVLLVLSAAFIAAVVSYHAFLRLGEQNDWAIVKSISAVADAREVDAQNRYLRENLDVMAKRLGELQARLVQLDSLGERVAGMAGLDIKDIKAMPDGFEIEFTMPVDASKLKNPMLYNINSFTYMYHHNYGSPIINNRST